MAVRVTSEDANDGFKPTCGLIEELSFRSTPEVWGYFSVKSGGGIHEFSDSQVWHSVATRQILSLRDSSKLCKAEEQLLQRQVWGLHRLLQLPGAFSLL